MHGVIRDLKKIVILGSGVSGHSAALYLKKYLQDRAEITVISPVKKYNWIPSNVWVAINKMEEDDVSFLLPPVYQKEEINFIQGSCVELYPEGTVDIKRPHVIYELIDESLIGQKRRVVYDFLINATGPDFCYNLTPGLGPDFFTNSICTSYHAKQTGEKLKECIELLKKRKEVTFVVGMGHGQCTCEGAAFEYILNIDAELRKNNVRENARLIYLTNEAELGDFGVDGIQIDIAGHITPSNILAESLFIQQKIEWILGAHVKNITKNTIEYESLDAVTSSIEYNFAMLLPPIKGHLLKTFNKNGVNISDKVFNENHFMKVDADYSKKNYNEWNSADWPKYYKNLIYQNLFAIGIAFAVPHQISAPRRNSNDLLITPSAPRTGMPSALMGKIVARNIANLILKNNNPPLSASMAEIGSAFITSLDIGFKGGAALSITMAPIVPNFEKYPTTGRDSSSTFGEIGRAGYWIKRIFHDLFLYKAKAKLFWWLIPE